MGDCQQCGSQLTERARFCAICGEAVISGESTPVRVGRGERGSRTSAPVSSQARNVAMVIHLSSFAGFFLPFIGNVVAPLVIWLSRRDESAFIYAHGKAALNFQISLCIYFILGAIFLFALIGFPLFIGSIFLILALVAFWFIAVIIAAVRASKGLTYRYPLDIGFLQ